MSAAGTSLADLAHQAYDSAAWAVGYGPVEEEGGEQQTGEDQDQQQQSSNRSSSSSDGRPFGGPGNHPSDPSAPTFGDHPDDGNDSYSNKASQVRAGQQQRSSKNQQVQLSEDDTDNTPAEDSIARALGSNGPVSQYANNGDDIDIGQALGKRSGGKKTDYITKDRKSVV